jgi:HemY protein
MSRWMPSFWLFLKIAVLAVAIIGATLYPGEAQITWMGYVINLPVAVVLAAIVVVFAILILIYHTWRYLRLMPYRMKNVLEQRRVQKGEKLLLEGLTAIAAQQPEEAAESVEFAKSLIPNHPLTVFIAAQSAHLAKDSAKASEYFYEMIQNPQLAFMGYRGLIAQAQEKKDWHQVKSFLNHAFKLRPDSPWVVQEMLKTQIYLSRLEIIPGQETLPVYRYVPRAEWKRHEALCLWLQSLHLSETAEDYVAMLVRAHQLDPSLMSVSIALAKHYERLEDMGRAQKVLIHNFKVAPHRDICKAWLDLWRDLNGAQQYKYLEKLTKHNPIHYESIWSLAECAFKNQLWGQARSHVEALLKESETAEGYLLMAKIAEAEHPHLRDPINYWQEKALACHTGFVWRCRTCNYVHEEWGGVCDHCEATDTIEWKLINGEQRMVVPLLISG